MMAISKTTRYEVLRRDGFACRYCGGKAPDVELTVDHVVPVALGGDDKPENLVAACKDCNAGKGKSNPDAETVADVAEDAQRWRRAMEEASRRANARTTEERDMLEDFCDTWNGYTIAGTDKNLPVSTNWEATVLNYFRAGLPVDEIVDAVEIAMRKRGVAPDGRYPYFCGVARKKLESLAEDAARLIEDGEV